MFKLSVLDINTALPVFKEMVSVVVLPGEEGELTILNFHQTMISCLKEGLLRIDNNPPMMIKGGIAKMKDDELVVLVEKE